MDKATTLLVVTAAILLGMAFSFYIVNTRYPAAIRRAVTYYATANVLVATGNLIVAFGEPTYPALAQIADLLPSAVGTCLYFLAFRSLDERRLHLSFVGMLYALAAIGVVYFCGVEHDVSMGLLSVCVLDIVLFSLLARDLLVFFRGHGRAHLITGIGLILFIVMLVLWSIELATQPHFETMIDHMSENSAYALGGTCFAAALGSVNFLLMCNDEFNTRLLTLVATDPLTGIANRRRLMEKGEEEVSRARRYAYPLTVMVLDLDHFKKLNDTFGHAAGDYALREAAQVCEAALRDIDLVSRSGGEEFAILLPQTPLARGLEVAERLRAAIAGIDLSWGAAKLPLTASLGIAELQPDDASIDQVIARADRALYRSKSEGRNRVSHSAPDGAPPSAA